MTAHTAGFTPSPWMAAARPSSIVGWPVVAQPHGRLICNMAHVPVSAARSNDADVKAFYAEVEANARLIAAAPDLLERLQAIIDWCDFAMANPGEFDSHGVRNLDGPVFDEARAALPRAEGRSE